MLKPALARYRAIAWIVGVLLLLLTAGTIMKYVGGDERVVTIVGPLHGFLYLVYLVLAADLARRARWPLGYTVLVLLAGTIPLLTFVAERAVTRRVRAGSRQPVGGAGRR